MFVNRWRLHCPDCSAAWDTLLEEDTDPEHAHEKCPACGNPDNNLGDFVARV